MTQAGGVPEPMAEDEAPQGVVADLQQVIQNFIAQHPQAAQVPAAQLVEVVEVQVQAEGQGEVQAEVQAEVQGEVQGEVQAEVQGEGEVQAPPLVPAPPPPPPPPPAAPPDRRALIGAQLALFMGAYPNAGAIGQDVPGALVQLTTNMGNVGIVYQQAATSRQNNPGVHGLHIGELLDMLHTLTTFANQAGFQEDRFWDKLVTMHEIMTEDPDAEDDEDGDGDGEDGGHHDGDDMSEDDMGDET